jgi:uncharacterized protein (DUF697 family)
MNEQVKKTVRKTGLFSASVGAVLSPIPLADEIVLFPVYANLARKIGKAHGLSLTQVPWRPVGATTMNGLLVRALLNLAVAATPGVAAVANAASAAALTELLGRYFDEACEQPAQAKTFGLRAMGRSLKNAMRRKAPAAA